MHTRRVFRGLVKAQFLRISILNTENDKCAEQMRQLMDDFMNRGYTKEMVFGIMMEIFNNRMIVALPYFSDIVTESLPITDDLLGSKITSVPGDRQSSHSSAAAVSLSSTGSGGGCDSTIHGILSHRRMSVVSLPKIVNGLTHEEESMVKEDDPAAAVAESAAEKTRKGSCSRRTSGDGYLPTIQQEEAASGEEFTEENFSGEQGYYSREDDTESVASQDRQPNTRDTGLHPGQQDKRFVGSLMGPAAACKHHGNLSDGLPEKRSFTRRRLLPPTPLGNVVEVVVQKKENMSNISIKYCSAICIMEHYVNPFHGI
ncbi:uncharacterized protein LOC122808331 [Protopterus annectens]|uniref:uncharacterized protein LOC122808331 n=1 Tax=Protopterus annectens TaxID=7888 RepID=UPI001CFB4D1F|nr:uncharacterized protein LOC122808331 [Protopterus annectens]